MRHPVDITPSGYPGGTVEPECQWPGRELRFRVGFACSAAILTLALGGCGERRQPEVRIGLLVSTEESLSPPSFAQVTREGAQLAIDEANATGGVLIGETRYRVVIRERTHEPRANDVTSATLALINLDSVAVIVGPINTLLGIPASTVAERASIPMISPSATNKLLTQGKRFVFRIATDDSLQGDELAHYAISDLGARRAAILNDETMLYARSVAESFAATFAADGGLVVAHERYTVDRRENVRTQMQRIAATQPDVLLLPNPSPADTIQVLQAREAGVKATFLMGDNVDLLRIERFPGAEGTISLRQWHEDIPRERSMEFVSRYRAKFGETPRQTAAATYDAVRLALDAMDRANSVDPNRIREALASTDSFEGVTGWMRFRGRQDAGRGGVLVKVTGGKNVLVRVVDPNR